MKNKKILNQLLKSLRKVYKNKNKYYKIHHPILNNSDKRKLNQCIDSSYVSSVGNMVDKFEFKLKKITKAKYVVCVVNGTAAIHIALKLIGVKNNDEVLLPSFNFVASSNACLYLNAVPIYFDSDHSLGPDIFKLENFFKKQTKIKNNKCFNIKTKRYIKACVPTYSYGHAFNITKLLKICKKYKVKIVEDSSEALGSKYKNRHLGTFGDIGILSFNGNKIVTTGGGGAIITNNKYYANKARHITTTSKINSNYQTFHNEIGYNYRLPNLNAALGLSQISRLNLIINKKRKLYKSLFHALKKMKDYFEIFNEPRLGKSNYWIQLLVIKKKN